MKKYKTLEVLGYEIFTSSVNDISLTSKCVINAINQYSYVVAERDIKFKEALLASDVLIPDGIGIVAATRWIYKKKIKKIAGSDVHAYFLRQLNETGGRCFYLGASDDTLVSIQKRLAKEYPNISMEYYSPPFKKTFTEEENRVMVEKINAFNPDVLFVGMTAPKQEKWTYENKNSINANIICCIGAVFDFYSGVVRRPSPFWIKLGLEWFMRMLNEPIHLWKRYIYFGPVFVRQMIKKKLEGNPEKKTDLITTQNAGTPITKVKTIPSKKKRELIN